MSNNDNNNKKYLSSELKPVVAIKGLVESKVICPCHPHLPFPTFFPKRRSAQSPKINKCLFISKKKKKSFILHTYFYVIVFMSC